MGNGNNTAFKVRGIRLTPDKCGSGNMCGGYPEFARDNKMNTLVFHQNDLADQLVNPEAFLQSVERYMPFTCHAVENNRAYIRR